MALSYNTSLRNNMVTQILSAMDAGASAATCEIRSGTRPSSTSDAATGSLLGTLTFQDPSGTVSTGVLTMSGTPQDSSADATGTATWFRVKDSNGTVIMDGDITASGGGGDIELSSVSITAGGPIQVTSWTITAPGATKTG